MAGPILGRLLAEARGDPRILGITLGGSGVSDTMDVHSDLDLVVVVAGARGPEVVGELPQIARRLGPMVACFTGEHVGEPRLLIALYGPPALHVDLKAVTVEELAERVEDGRILWERGDAVSSVVRRTAARWPQPDPQWMEDRFWVWLHYGVSRTARGEYLECIDLLAAVRAMVFGPLLALSAGVKPQGVRRLERLAPDRVAGLLGTVGGGGASSCFAALGAAAALYDDLRPDWVQERSAARRLALDHLDDLGAAAARAARPDGTSAPRVVITRWVELRNAGDADALAALYDDDAVDTRIRQPPIRGRVAIREALSREVGAARATVVPSALHAEGDTAILEWRDAEGAGRCGVFTVRAGRIVGHREYASGSVRDAQDQTT